MSMKHLGIIFLIALAACGKPEERNAAELSDKPAPSPAPAVNNSTNDMLLGGAIGYMLGSSGRSTVPAPAPVVVERQTIIKRTTPQSPVAPLAPAAAPAPKPATPAPKPSYAPTQAYQQKQNTPTYNAPPKQSYSVPTRSYSSSGKR